MELFQRRTDDAVVASSRAGTTTAAELYAHAAKVQSVLPPAAPGSAVAFAFGSDRAAFAAALLGTWAAGHRAALPPDARRESVTPVLARDDVVEFLHDTGVGRGIDVTCLKPAAGESLQLGPGAFDADPDVVRLSVHDRLALPQDPSSWTLGALARRVDELARTLRFEAGDVVASGVAPTYLSALLVDLLLPLRHAGRFVVDVPANCNEARVCIQTLKPRIWTDSAIGLHRLAASPTGALDPVEAALCATPDRLDEPALRSLESTHGSKVEYLASSVARPGAPARVRAALWSLPAVLDAEAAVLESRPDEPYAMVVTDADVSPPELERQLESEQLSVAELRIVRILRRDPNGRVDDSDLFREFGLRADGRPLVRDLTWRVLPAFEDQEAEADRIERFETHVPETYAYYDGHFTTYAVMAGAVQLNELLLPCLRRIVPGATLTKLESVKFLARVAPGDDIAVELRVDKERERVSFTVLRGDKRLTTGRAQWRVRAHG